jgi:signal peptidase I
MKNNIKSATPKKWIKFSLLTIAVLLFVFWTGNAWWLLVLPFIFDIYISRFVKWDAWKQSKNKTLKSIAEWTDAIVFALIAVYLINIYFFQNYKIPSSSLEKTLLVGDFLFVSKLAYGPRTPMTPLSFPLAQHTLPVINTKSYLEKPQFPYKRLKGLRNLERNDLVVFNFPAGDTVALKHPNSNYYELEAIYGHDAVKNNENAFGKIIYRPVDRRENYVKRCVAVAGDTLVIIDNQVYINGEKQIEIPGLQFYYLVETNGQRLTSEFLSRLGISYDDMKESFINNPMYLQNAGYTPNANGTFNPVYQLPLTKEMHSKLENMPSIKSINVMNRNGGFMFPDGLNSKWTIANYGPIWIPKKGETVALDLKNLPLYERIIKNYEHNKLEVKGGLILINDEFADSYTFQMDYYWMMGDNRHNSADSRSFGFVPENHIVGQPIFVWLSLDKDKGWFDGKIRFNRFFKNAKR